MPGVLFVSKSSTSHVESAVQKEGVCSFSVPHVSEFFMWQRFVRCPLISRRVPVGISAEHLPGASTDIPGWEGAPGQSHSLVWAAPRLSTTSSDAAVFAHYLPKKAAAYGVLAFSAGKAGWVMVVWCRNLPVLRAGGQMFPSLIAKWVRKYWVWIGIVDCMAKKTSPGSYKTNQNKVRDFAWFVGSLSDHQVRWRSQSCLLTWTERI